MPEGDTIFRTAAALRGYLEGRRVLAARARVPGPRMEKVVGATVTRLEPRGKHLVIHFDNGLALHTHLRMGGSWHRYAPGEPWRRAASQARVVLEVADSVVVCFNAPVAELMAEATVERHPSLATLGPDLLAPGFDADEAVRRLRAPERAGLSLAEALLDQRAMAGVGNVFKSEVLFIERLDPSLTLAATSDATLRQMVATAERLLRANVSPDRAFRVTTDASAGGSRTWVYGRAGRPCLRCGAQIRRAHHGDPRRSTYWCPRCQNPTGSV